MGVKVLKVAKNGKGADIWDTHQKVKKLKLKEDDVYPVLPASGTFKNQSRITRFELYHAPKIGPMSLIWTWHRDNPSLFCEGYLAVVPYADVGIIIINTNSTPDDIEDLYFKVIVTDGDGDFSSDPELQVPKRSEPVWAPGGDSDPRPCDETGHPAGPARKPQDDGDQK